MVAFRPETNPDQFLLEGVEKMLALMGLQAALGIRNTDTKTVSTPVNEDDVRPKVYEALMGSKAMETKPKGGYPTKLEPGWVLVEYAPVVAEAIQQGIDHIEQKLHPHQANYPEIGREALQSLAVLMQPEQEQRLEID